MRPKTADLVTFTDKYLNGKLHFMCNVPSNGFKGNKKYLQLGKYLKICKMLC